MILHDNKIVTSISKITNIANNQYKNKVNNIRNKFKHDSINPIQLLQHLIPKFNSVFTLPLPTEKDVADI